jgi:hypothetical protein
MKRKPIKIDWDEIEEAFSTPEEEAEFYLDAVTGRVALEGEGDLEPDDEDDAYEQGRPVPNAGAGIERDDPTRIPIVPPDTETKIEWLQGFLREKGRDHDAKVVAELTAAADAADPTDALGEVLNRNPGVRDAWYVYRADRLHELIDEWLADYDLQCTDPPPWRR